MSFNKTEDFKSNGMRANEYARAPEFLRQLAAQVASKGAQEYLQEGFEEPQVRQLSDQLKELQARNDMAAECSDKVEELKSQRIRAGGVAGDDVKNAIAAAEIQVQLHPWTTVHAQRLSNLQTRLKADKILDGEIEKKTAEILIFVAERVDSKMRAKVCEIQGDAAKTTTQKLRDVVKYLNESMKGDLSRYRNDIKNGLNQLKTATTNADVRENMARIEDAKNKVAYSVTTYGGHNPLVDEELIRTLIDSISQKSLALHGLKSFVEVITNAPDVPITWSGLEVAVTKWLDKQQKDGKDETTAMMIDGANKGRQRDGEGSSTAVYAANERGPGRGPGSECFLWKQDGVCRYGKNCKFSHEGRKAKKEDDGEKRGRGRDRSQSRDKSRGENQDNRGDNRDRSTTRDRSRSRDRDCRRERDEDRSESEDSAKTAASARIPAGTLRSGKPERK